MSQELYRVILTGYGDRQKGEHYIEEAFAKLFKIQQAKARQLLKSAPTTLKENLPAVQADLYKEAIAKTGAACDVENMKYNLSGLSLE